MKLFKNLVRDESGATIVELALMAPIMATMLIGMVDLSFGYSEKLELEQAAQRAVERVMQQRSASSDYSDIKAEAAAHAGVPESAVTVDFWLECNGTRADSVSAACADGETYARYVEVDVTDKYTPYIGTKFLGANDDGSYTLTGTAGIRIQ